MGGGYLNNVAPIYIPSSISTRTVTHEVIREVAVAPPPPRPIKCPNCGTSYIPSEHKFICPNCGAPPPPDLIAQIQPLAASSNEAQ